MPVSYSIEESGRLVLARYDGEITLDQIAEMFAAYLDDPAFAFERPHLADLSGVTETDIGFSETYALFSLYLRSYAANGQHMRVAIHAPHPVAFGIARIFQNLAESSDVIEAMLFDTFEAARDWALDPPDPADRSGPDPGPDHGG